MSERRKEEEESARGGIDMGGTGRGGAGKLLVVSGKSVRERPEKRISRLEASKGRLKEMKP